MKSNNSNTAVVWENELQALKNALTSFNLKGYEVWPNHNGFRSKTTFLLRDEEGNSITGSWNYDRLNHFILGYGKAFEKANNPQPKEPTHITWWEGLNENGKIYAISTDSRCSLDEAKKIWNDCQGEITDEKLKEIYLSNKYDIDNPSISDHITWWKGLNEEEKYKLCCKHFQGIPVDSLMERSIKVMYHYENPETTTNTVTSEGFTKGNWAVRDYEVIGPYGSHKTICEMTGNLPKEEKKANAKRIVNCVNNHDALVSALKGLLDKMESSMLTADIEYYEKEKNAAKQVLNQINQL